MTDIENKIREAWNAVQFRCVEKVRHQVEWKLYVDGHSGDMGERIREFRLGYLAAHQEAAAQVAQKSVPGAPFLNDLGLRLKKALGDGCQECGSCPVSEDDLEAVISIAYHRITFLPQYNELQQAFLKQSKRLQAAEAFLEVLHLMAKEGSGSLQCGWSDYDFAKEAWEKAVKEDS